LKPLGLQLMSAPSASVLRSGTAAAVDMQVILAAGHDSMLLNLCGAHGPFFVRNIVVLRDSAPALA